MCQFKHSIENEQNIKCNVCNKTFQSSEELDDHITSKHSSDPKENVDNECDKNDPEEEDSVATCLQCGEMYDDVDDLINHYMDKYHNLEQIFGTNITI